VDHFGAVRERWCCQVCQGTGWLKGREAFLAHCREAHPEVLNAEGRIEATREALIHLDGEEHSQTLWVYEFLSGQELARCYETAARGEAFSATARRER